MIVDLERFIAAERDYWNELESILKTLAARAGFTMNLPETRRFYYLYRRAASDLARIRSCTADEEITAYLEGLVARAYAEIHETRRHPHRLRPLEWFLRRFPQTVRRRRKALLMSVLVMALGTLFGMGATLLDPEAKAILIPFSQLHGNPSERVAEEEESMEDRLEGHRSGFAAALMTNNIKVSIMAMAMGVFWGFGTLVILFYNGAMLGAVLLDYARAGEGIFLTGWLLPHGSIEIPAILLAGQAGFVLGNAIIGWGTAKGFRQRMRETAPDLVYLIYGVAVMLVWAGIVEAFFSQYHEPTVPYWLKITFGALELIVLAAFLLWAGKTQAEKTRKPHET